LDRHPDLAEYDLLDEDADSPTGTIHEPRMFLPPDFDRSIFAIPTVPPDGTTAPDATVVPEGDSLDVPAGDTDALAQDDATDHSGGAVGDTHDVHTSNHSDLEREVTPPPEPRRSDRARRRTVRFVEQANFTTVSHRPQYVSDALLNRPRYQSSNLSKQRIFPSDPARLQRVRQSHLNQQALARLDWSNLRDMCIKGTYGFFLAELNQNIQDGYVEEWNPALLGTKANAEDNPSWNHAMNGPLANGFLEACKTELATLDRKDAWDVVDRPKGKPVVSSTWAFKIKRLPDGTVRKLKAGFCARGYEQTEGVDYNETFAPVVNWATVRFLLVMSILLNLNTK
jgi:hypothetical protein